MKLARQYSLLGWVWPVLVGLDTRILPGDFGRSALAHIFTLNNEGVSHPRSFEIVPIREKRLDRRQIAVQSLP